MNKTLLILNVALVALTIVLAWKVITSVNSTQSSAVALTNTVPQIPPPISAEQSNALHAPCRAQVAMLSGVLSNAMGQLASARQRIQDLEAASAPVVNPPVPTPGPASKAGSALLPRPVVRSYFFEKLLAANGEILGRDLEFTGLYGRRVAFKETNSTRRVAFDVDQLHLSVLEALAIDATEQKALQVRQDRAWKQLENANLAAAQAEEQRRQERRAAEEAARAEEQRRMAEEQERQEAYDRANQPPAGTYPVPNYPPWGYQGPQYNPPAQPMPAEPPR